MLWANLDRAVWRELHAITVLRKDRTANRGAPLVVQSHAGNLGLELDIWTGALVTDGKAKILDVVESVFHVPARLFDDAGRELYGRGVAYAQIREQHLREAVRAYGKELSCQSPPVARAQRHYWNALDQQATRLLDIVRDSTAVVEFGGASSDPWTKAVRGALHEAYDHACPRETPRQIEAYAGGLRELQPRAATAKSKRHKRRADNQTPAP